MTAGWVDTTLGDVARIVSGATPKTGVAEYWDGGVPWVTPKDLSELGGKHEISATPRTLSDAGLKSCAASLLPSGSVLLSSRAPIGHVAINTVPMATNQGFKSLVPDRHRLDSKFLYWWLRRNRPMLESLGNGATFKEISKKTTADVPISLPPIEEQRRIAAVLDAADSLRTKRRQALAKLGTLTQAIFIDMFGDPAQGRFPMRTLGDLVRAGITRGIDQPGPDFKGGTPYIKTTNFGLGTPTRESLACSAPEIAARFPRSVVEEGDTVVCIRATVGPALLVGRDLAGVNLSRGTARISPSEDVLPEFLFTAVCSDHFQRQIQRKLRGATFLQIPLGELKALEVPLPGIDLQRRFVELRSAAEAQHATQHRQSKEFETLFLSLQQRAFRGEL